MTFVSEVLTTAGKGIERDLIIYLIKSSINLFLSRKKLEKKVPGDKHSRDNYTLAGG